MLEIAIEKIGFIVELLREYTVLVPPSELHDGENASDHGGVTALEDTSDNPVETELEDFINALNIDEKIELIALIWVGRGDFTDADWTEARNQAEDEYDRHATARYIMGTPQASEFLEEALNQFGYSIAEAEEDFMA